MACGSGCCDPPSAAACEQTVAPNAPTLTEDKDSCCSDCGGGGDGEDTAPAADQIKEASKSAEIASAACTDACCGETGPGAEDNANDDGDSCCGDCADWGPHDAPGREAGKPLSSVPMPFQDACCSGPSEMPESNSEADKAGGSCCGDCDDKASSEHPAEETSKGLSLAKSPCREGCCNEPSRDASADVCEKSNDATVAETADCCAGKPAPCCDESCLDRLALRACEEDSDEELAGSSKIASSTAAGSSTSGARSSACSRGKGGRPCADHVRRTRATYGVRLAALGCLCRGLLARGQASCCPETSSPWRRRSGHRERPSEQKCPPRASVSDDSCCAADGADAGCCGSSSAVKKPPPGSKAGCCSGGTQSGCCGDKPTTVAADAASCCEDACCGNETKANAGTNVTSIEIVPNQVTQANAAADLEKGLLLTAEGEVDHVILSISGMTCTGCETKLVRTLGAHPLVRNLKTSLVLSRAEFDLVEDDAAAAAAAEEVMRYLERTTEFKCERVANKGVGLDLVVSSNENSDGASNDAAVASFVRGPWPDGVTDVRRVDKTTIHVRYDPQLVGARDLLAGRRASWGDGRHSLRLAPPRPDPTLASGSKHVRHVGWMTALSAVLTIPVLVLAWAPLPQRPVAYGSASLALATLVQFLIAGPFYPKALKALVFSRVVEMDLLVVLSTTAAYVFSVVSFGYTVAGRPLATGAEFFETSTLLVTLIMVGRWVAALARQKAVESVSLRTLQAPTACLVTNDEDDRGGEREIDARLLQYGDVFKVAPDARIPTDGTVVAGVSEVDESMLTGESRPVEKRSKSPVVAGSLNGAGTLLVRLTRLPGDNTITAIAGMVDAAKLSKPKIQNAADRIAGLFVPVVLSLAVATFAVWVAVGVAARGQRGSTAAVEALTYAITVLIVSCPCAIGLAVPMVFVIASGVAAEHGVVFKSAAALEAAHRAAHVVLDKTGTVTQGRLTVVREHWYGDNAEKNGEEEDRQASHRRALLLGLVTGIKHPVAAAVAQHLRTQRGTVPAAPVADQKTLPAKGVVGTAQGSGAVLKAGNARWLQLADDAVVQAVLARGHTAFCFTVDGAAAAVFGLADELRPDAATTVQALAARGVAVHLLSGDDEGPVRAAAAALRIDPARVRAHCTPADKQAYVRTLVSRPTGGRRNKTLPVVLFCGDGTNDAAALAQATVGVHMHHAEDGGSGGTDVAQAAADVVLLRADLAGLLTVLAVSRKAMHRVAFNFAWSFVYNLVAVLFGAGAFVRARLPPAFAGLGELVSVLPVIAAAVLLRWSKL